MFIAGVNHQSSFIGSGMFPIENIPLPMKLSTGAARSKALNIKLPTGLYRDFQRCSEMFRDVQRFSEIFRDFQGKTF
jgi:hypothetical protein